jgi:hypothetical protein
LPKGFAPLAVPYRGDGGGPDADAGKYGRLGSLHSLQHVGYTATNTAFGDGNVRGQGSFASGKHAVRDRGGGSRVLADERAAKEFLQASSVLF